jgi:hypothetical protein
MWLPGYNSETAARKEQNCLAELWKEVLSKETASQTQSASQTSTSTSATYALLISV